MLNEEFVKKALQESVRSKKGEGWEWLSKELDFDVSTVKNETQLRNLIMERVIQSAGFMFSVSTNKGKVLLGNLPKELREKKTDAFITKLLESVKGPGLALRHRIATLILHYRMWLRLQTMLSNLTPSSPDYEKTAKATKHIDAAMCLGMFMLYAWPLENDDTEIAGFERATG